MPEKMPVTIYIPIRKDGTPVKSWERRPEEIKQPGKPAKAAHNDVVAADVYVRLADIVKNTDPNDTWCIMEYIKSLKLNS